MDLVIASNNKHKIEEFKQVFSKYGVNVFSLKELNINVDPEETGKTFEENAKIKAVEVAKYTDKVVVADDSGIEISCLNGFPGIYSARFMENNTYEEKFVELNKMMGDSENRVTNYNCSLAVANLTEKPLVFVGKVFGEFLKETRGNGGFGYDPIFFYPPFNCTFGECSQEKKNEVSHRGVAIQMLLKYLVENNYL